MIAHRSDHICASVIFEGAMAPRFFATPAAFRAWMERHHADEDELLDPLHAAP
jgi:hypothetical protein